MQIIVNWLGHRPVRKAMLESWFIRSHFLTNIRIDSLQQLDFHMDFYGNQECPFF